MHVSEHVDESLRGTSLCVCVCKREASAAHRMMTSVMAAAPDRSRVLHRADFLTTAVSLYPHLLLPPPTSSPARAQKANALYLTTGTHGAHTRVYACLYDRGATLCVQYHAKWFGEMAVSLCPLSPCLYIHFSYPSVNK